MCDGLLLLRVLFFWGGYILIFGSGVGHQYTSIRCRRGLHFVYYYLSPVIPPAYRPAKTECFLKQHKIYFWAIDLQKLGLPVAEWAKKDYYL